MMKGRVMRRLLVAVTLAVLGAVWAGGAAAVPPQRTVGFEDTYTYRAQPCGDALIVVHDVGRITFTDFFNPDGSLKVSTIHDAAITSTQTNTETGATLTSFYSNFVQDRLSIDPRSGVITEILSFNGLNFIVEGRDGRRVVSAGRGVFTFLITFDADGNLIGTPIGGTSTPNLVHVSQLLCAP